MSNKASKNNEFLVNPTLRFNVTSDGKTRWELRRSGGASDTLAFVYVKDNSAKEFFNVGGPTGWYGAYYNEIPFTKSNNVVEGNIWITAYGRIAIVTVQCHVKSRLSSWSSYSLGTLTSHVWTYNVNGTCMDQDSGTSHVLGCGQGKNILELNTKGEPLPSDKWIWGQIIAIINEK